MAVAYDIKAHPTVYGGRQYRSRLEAKWAAFFDRLGWQYEYEPIDFGSWSPDFVLLGDNGRQVYVEVKPITAMDADVTAKIDAAHPHGGDALLVGLAPFRDKDAWPADLPFIGWIGQGASCQMTADGAEMHWRGWDEAPFAWYMEAPGVPDFTSKQGSFHGALSGHYDGGSWGDAPKHCETIWRAWNDAANAVQWRKR